MSNNAVPTKGNLMAAKNTLKLSVQGYELLDKKRNILVREMMSLIDKAQEVQSHIDGTFSEAYEALQMANINLGIHNIEKTVYAIDEEKGIAINTRSIMGVEIPMAAIDEGDSRPQYGLKGTSVALDVAREKFIAVKKLTVQLAEIENAIYRLAVNIKKTQKRANALKNIMIPRYEELVKFITESLEEKEREEFTRLKMIKKIKA
ncbi:V-type ATP synthase subunit D [Bianquea renquensis]|jgi:V-type ATPase, D subunit|uniref:V-type ATP synthase subunit D n=1 Tax=Bianquea renquensis TaxID=2763661 RepID=A0A926DT98_9FIRM|nr:V-type ATP synthase subunit D [Bianquea renquensis]MBC8544883.1 V-type ATP synthase subunit D [Bianquea renquensis]